MADLEALRYRRAAWSVRLPMGMAPQMFSGRLTWIWAN